jgi:hypothetical protein
VFALVFVLFVRLVFQLVFFVVFFHFVCFDDLRHRFDVSKCGTVLSRTTCFRLIF